MGCIFPVVISSEFRPGQYRDGDHREDALHFNYQFDHQDWATKRQHLMLVGKLIEKIIFYTENFVPQVRTV